MRMNVGNGAMMSSNTQIPEGWQMARLGDVCTPPEYGAAAASIPYDASLPRYVRITDITDDGRLRVEDKRSADPGQVEGYHLEDGDLLFARSGSVGRTYLYQSDDGPCVFAGYLIRFCPLPDHAIPEYLEHWTHSNSYYRWITSVARRGAQTNINAAEYSSLPLLLPPLPEQRAIAAVLDSIDDAIEGAEAVIAATEQLRDSLLHQLLTRGVPGWHTEWKEAPGLGTIPAGWEVVRLGDVAEVERGKFAHRPRNEPRFYGGSIPFIQTGDVVRANGKINQHSQTLNKLGLSISRLFPAGTIIITIAANIGETAIASYPVAFPDSLVGVTPYGIDTNFLEYFLRTQKLRLNQFAPESAQKNINLEDLRPLSAPLPPLPEQQAIAAVLDGVDGAIEKAKTGANMLKSLKEATAEALLTGRVRVEATQT